MRKRRSGASGWSASSVWAARLERAAPASWTAWVKRAGPAIRVAAAATVITAVAYAVTSVVLSLVLSHRLTGREDGRLQRAVAACRLDPGLVSHRSRTGLAGDPDDGVSPVYLWQLSSGGSVVSQSPDGPAWALAGPPRPGFRTVHQGPVSIRTLTERLDPSGHQGGWLVAGVSQATDLHTEHLLRDWEIVAAPPVLLAMFGGSLIVGLRALAPVEQARRRQLEFTADASHELRTPVSVIQAEADVALAAPRTPEEYRDTLSRVQGESQRLRRLVDDLLWLARSDSAPPPPRDEPVDLGVLAAACADRFRAVGPAISTEAEPVLISAPPEWIDRLAGVLIDNACRYAGPDGQVRVTVRAEGGRAILAVEDSGPGIPPEQRPWLFDRFHRLADALPGASTLGTGDAPPVLVHPGAASTAGGAGVPQDNSKNGESGDSGSGAGLGLAIADSIAVATGGRWHVGASQLGGALMEVSWRPPSRFQL